MTVVYRIPPAPTPRPFAEQCQGRFCGATYAGGPDRELIRVWRLAHAHHWDEEGDEA